MRPLSNPPLHTAQRTRTRLAIRVMQGPKAQIRTRRGYHAAWPSPIGSHACVQSMYGVGEPWGGRAVDSSPRRRRPTRRFGRGVGVVDSLTPLPAAEGCGPSKHLPAGRRALLSAVLGLALGPPGGRPLAARARACVNQFRVHGVEERMMSRPPQYVSTDKGGCGAAPRSPQPPPTATARPKRSIGAARCRPWASSSLQRAPLERPQTPAAGHAHNRLPRVGPPVHLRCRGGPRRFE